MTAVLRAIPAGALLLAVLAGCGGSASHPATATTTVTATAATDAPPPATAAGSKNTDPKVRAKVFDLQDKFNKDHQALTDVYVKTFGPFPPTEERVDSIIAAACKSKANNFRMPDKDIGLLTVVFGKAILDSGTDVVTYVGQVMDRDRKIANLIDCP